MYTIGKRISAVRILTVVLVVSALFAACSDDEDDAVQIGPTSWEKPPAEALLDEDPGEEPGWLPQVPGVQSASASSQELSSTANLAASFGLSSPPATVASTAVTDRENHYSGTMTIEIAYYDYCQTYDGNLGYAGTATYDIPADVYINPRAEHEGVQERSPFNLIVSSEVGVEGSILMMSGQVATDNRDGSSVLIDYWDIAETSSGEIEGVLTDRNLPLIFNYIESSQLIYPCQPSYGSIATRDSIAEGAEITGTVTGDDVALELVGQSLDRELRFRATLEAGLV